MAFQPGEQVGDYEIVGVLGRGGMGKVFRVRNILSGRLEAMKVVLPESTSHPGAADRFLREIRVHASLEHPHIAHLRTALRAGDQVVMIMELVDGVGLDEYLRRRVVALTEGVRFMDQVLSALEYAHARGVVHRDIKPANIIVAADRNVKLTDLGIARAPGDPSYTLTGMALGSLHYMSPEQVRAQPLDARSDLYSLGVTLYEIAAGRRPFEADNDYAILTAQVNQAPPPPNSFNPSIPPRLGEIILKALAKDPAARFQTAAEFREALRNLAGVELAPTAATTAPISAPVWDPAFLESARQSLAAYAGPIAGVIVQRAARTAKSREELLGQLAAEIPESERRAFLSRLRG